MDLLLSDGARLAYQVRGSGPPILLFSPLGGSLVSWDAFAAILSQRLRVITFDPRGAGDSSDAPWAWTTRRCAADARALLDHLDVPRCHVYGISMGGMAAQWLAIDEAARVDKLVLASTVPYGLEFRYQALGRALSLALCLTKNATDVDACLATRVLSHAFRADHPDEVDRIRTLARVRPTTRANIARMLVAAARHDARSSLARIAAPTLVLVGARDPLPTGASQAELLTTIPNVQRAVIAEAGHDLSAESPIRTAEHVLAFLNE